MKRILVVVLFLSVSYCAFSQKQITSPFADNSLSTDGYIKRGMPSPDRIWFSEDYKKAVEILKQIRIENKLLLPREDSKKSGAMFARMISNENLAFLKDSTPLKFKGMQLQGMGSLQELLAIYIDGSQYQGFSREVISQMIFLMEFGSEIYQFADSYKNNPIVMNSANPQIISGMQKMKQGVVGGINGSLIMLEAQDKSFEDADIERFSTVLKQIIPIEWPAIDESVKKEYLLRIERLGTNHRLGIVKNNMKDLYNILPKL